MIHTHRSLAAIVLIAAVCQLPHNLRADDAEVSKLHAVLQSDAPLHDKAVACERLAVVGTAESVPVLAGLLADEHLSHYARFGLEAIPGPEVNEAFRDALGQLEGQHLVGVINSIGQRKDAQAVEPLTKLMADADQLVASASAAALGQVANEDAVRTLLHGLEEKSNPLRPAIADACLAAAASLRDDGQSGAAQVVYQAIRESDLPKHIRFAAALSSVRAQNPASLALLNELLKSDDDEFFAVALQASRDVRGKSVTTAMMDELGRQKPQRQAQLLVALGDRGDKAALPALRAAAQSKEPTVQLAAIQALGQVGDSSVVELLMDLAVSADAAAANAARSTLEKLPGEEVNQAIVSQENQDDPKREELIIQLAGSRRIESAVPLLLKAMDSSNDAQRLAAIKSLGETAGREELEILVQRILSPKSPDEELAAKAALTAACVRFPDREGCANQVIALFAAIPAERRTWLFDLLRELGGETALKSVVAGASDGNDVTQDAATRVLGEWLTADVAPPLLELSQSLDNSKYQIRALRGYIRIFRQFGLPVEEQVAMAKNALRVAERDEDKNLVLQALVRFPAPESLGLATGQLESPGLKAAAAKAAVAIAGQLTESDPQHVRAAMQQVLDAQVDQETTKQARTILQKAKE